MSLLSASTFFYQNARGTKSKYMSTWYMSLDSAIIQPNPTQEKLPKAQLITEMINGWLTSSESQFKVYAPTSEFSKSHSEILEFISIHE